MAGGEGSRLKSISGSLPKPMVAVCGKPILQYQIENLRENGIYDIILVIGHLGDAIKDYFGDGRSFGVRISYFFEDHPMGTAGALYYLKEMLSEDFLLLMGDLMLDVDFQRFAAFHRRCGGLATLFVHPNAHPYDSDIIVTDTVGRLSEYDETHCGTDAFEALKNGENVRNRGTGMDTGCSGGRAGTHANSSGEANLQADKTCSTGEMGGLADYDDETHSAAMADVLRHALVTGVLGKKEPRPAFYHNQVNSGIYAFSPEILSYIREPKSGAQIEAELSAARQETPALSEEAEKKIRKSGKIDLDKDLIRPQIAKRQVYAYRSTEYVKDMGTPDRYEAVGNDLKNGIVASRNLKNPQKCIFLDRDGTVNALNGFVRSPEELVLLPGAAEAIGRINSSEYLCIIVTNQPVIARGDCSFEELDQIHAKLETELGKAGVYIDGLYFCPHHTDRGFAGEVTALKFRCGCRKPQPGLLLRAAADYHIDLSRSWLIGDSGQDVGCGKAAGTRTVLLKQDAEPDGEIGADQYCADLSEAVGRLLP